MSQHIRLRPGWPGASTMPPLGCECPAPAVSRQEGGQGRLSGSGNELISFGCPEQTEAQPRGVSLEEGLPPHACSGEWGGGGEV